MAAFLYAIYLLIISRLGKESSINIIFYTTLFTGMFGLVFALIESREFLPSSSAQFYNLLAMAILCQVGGQFFITYSLAKDQSFTRIYWFAYAANHCNYFWGYSIL